MRTSRDTIKYSKITVTCFGLLILVTVLYLYFLYLSVVQVVARTEFDKSKNDINAEIATLEADYIRAQHEVASRIADLDGYNTDTAKIFVSRENSRFVFVSQ